MSPSDRRTGLDIVRKGFYTMNWKKIMAAAAAGAFLFTAAPLKPGAIDMGWQWLAPVAEAAKGGARVGGISHAPAAAPKATPAKPAAGANSKSAVSGNGEKYAPSKDAKSLDKNAPASQNMGRGMTNTSQSTGWGSRLRNIGLFAGGMLLGSMLGSMFGFGGMGMMADVLGLLMNILIAAGVIWLVVWLIRRVRGGSDRRQYGNTYMQGRRQDIEDRPRHIDIQDIKPQNGDYDPKTTADRYRSR